MQRIIFFMLLITQASTILSAQNREITDPQAAKLYELYIQIKDALVLCDSQMTAQKAKAFAKQSNLIDYKIISEGNLSTLIANADAIAQSKNLTTQRAHFNMLSKNVSTLADNIKLSNVTIYQQYCPMAKGYWLSNTKEIKNPYYGKSMLNCGEVTKEINK